MSYLKLTAILKGGGIIMIQQVAEFLFTKVQKKKRKKGRYIVMIIIGRKGKAMGEIVRKFEFRNGGVDRWIGVKKIKERERENRWYLTGNVTRCHKGTFPMDQGQNILTYDIHKWQVFHLVHVAVDRDRISFFFFFLGVNVISRSVTKFYDFIIYTSHHR